MFNVQKFNRWSTQVRQWSVSIIIDLRLNLPAVVDANGAAVAHVRDGDSGGVGDSEEAASGSDCRSSVGHRGGVGCVGNRGGVGGVGNWSSGGVGGHRGVAGLSVDSGVGDAGEVLVAAGEGGGDALGLRGDGVEVAGAAVDVLGGGGQRRGGVAGVRGGGVGDGRRREETGVGGGERASEDCDLKSNDFLVRRSRFVNR